ncbi:centriolar and ciliogenesis-associated protein HYLS1 [Procambarus clarkii]|uniref:centriolar and ciliogenesis-associated protein HYLS1 n=1 Tax=Procambarus clarkii TaxID=6728 RepID=UPI001E675FBA|nr:uncharacterized protein LOC123762574 [Procambarus clarkii]XP_045605095.1 uncharacterized protein LOC123762574 [Procambarus clarkii]
MPYRLRVTEEEVREELTKLGFEDVSDENVERLRKDLLKLIKNDLRKVKQQRCQSRDLHDSVSHDETPAIPSKLNIRMPLPDTSTPIPPEQQMPSTWKSSVRPFGSSLSQSRNNANEDAEESGYSDFDSRASATSVSEREKSDSSSAMYSPSDSTTGARMSKEKIKSYSGLLQKNKIENRGRTFRHTHVDTHRMPTGPVVDSQVTLQRPTDDQSRGQSNGNKVNQDLRKQKVAGMAKHKDGLPEYPSRPDPVTLYHFYKAHWDKFKAPGEDPRSKLRWSVRTKLFYSK